MPVRRPESRGPGNAGSNTAADHISAARLALAQLPKKYRAGGRPSSAAIPQAALTSSSPGSPNAGAGPWLTTGIKRRPLQELTPTDKTRNRALGAARAPVERGAARLKSWRIIRRCRCSPNRMTSITKAVLTLELQR